ncbi:hypothetical protein [Labilibacter marinus]|uniref:hypothetical protein n=1 Tax=Labilibacter marinus TaxID=1477105 RepID=UPI00094F9CE4|nr:hypothetical protein [Labilibacter marinus]
MKNIYILFIAIVFISCEKQTVQIANLSNTKVGQHATEELHKYLNEIYIDTEFEVLETNADIQLMLASQAGDLGISNLPIKKESFLISCKDDKVYIIASDERGLLNAVYALLEKQGCGFFIGGDVVPAPKDWDGFSDWSMKDNPVLQDRSLFNWHNFLSGCTGWDLEDWKAYIDQANKMRYNGIMVHAYGNNPMFSYEYLGETKTTGSFNSSINGRDWGNQHINDVRRMVAGDIFDAPVYGAKPSLADEGKKVEVASRMMHDVFEYAEACGTKVIFALDFDTWMSHPQNIVKKLPKEALLNINGYLTPNPEHPEGYKYYKHQVQELVKKYPQIDELTVWSRSPKNKKISVLGSIWMEFPYEEFPEQWKKEYDQLVKENHALKHELYSQGMFTFSKIVKALLKAAGEVKPELKLGYGSWGSNWLDMADVLMPEGVPFRPLDVDFDSKKSIKYFTSVDEKRQVYPIIWAHHDDFAYIGRPFTPNQNFTTKAQERKIQGVGIIHWTTHPLDLYFTGIAKQLWEASANEPLHTTVDNYVFARFGTSSPQLSKYYYEWISKGPIFGRETSDNFIDLGKLHWKYIVKSWPELIPEAEARIKMLDAVPLQQQNDYWKYQRGMEQFYISFFKNQSAFTEAYKLAEDGKMIEAAELMKGTHPYETIQKFVDATKIIGFTAGEEALVLSLNTRWLVDYLNLKQRVALEPVRIRFSNTKHDPLAQGKGNNTYTIDDNGKWWICKWEHELPNNKFVNNEEEALLLGDTSTYKLRTMHGQNLVPGEYELSLCTQGTSKGNIRILSNNKEIATVQSNGNTPTKIKFKCNNCNKLYLQYDAGELKITAIEIYPI